MINLIFEEVLVGWGTGYSYATTKHQENEVKQGKNYYLAANTISNQLSQFATLISKINETLPEHSFKNSIDTLCNVVPLLSIPTSLFCATVKQGDYENLAGQCHAVCSYLPLPKKLGGHTVSFLSFFAEHSGDMIRVAMVVSSVALIALGQVGYGSAVLVGIAYEAVDHMGFVPRRISLFMEIYMPIVSTIGVLIGGAAISRVFATITLLTHIVPSIAFYLHARVDGLVRCFFTIKGPSLKAIDAPLVEKKEMTFDEINHILDDESFSYQINPAHCGKPLMNLDQLPTDQDFKKLIALFDTIQWQTKYTLVKNKLKDDERFIDFLFEKYPAISKEELAKNVDIYIQKLASAAKMSPEEYASSWMREQLVQFVDVLQGKERVKGSQQDLDEAIQICQILVPYLSALKNQVDLEDALLALAIEGGDYCGRGLKRVTNELLWGALQNALPQAEESEDPMRTYESRILQALQNRRLKIIENLYKELAKAWHIPDAVSKDVHGFDSYRLYFSLGFFPVTKFERNQIGLFEIFTWEYYASTRETAYTQYQEQLDDAIHEIGEADFGVYISQMINENQLLSEEQKEQLLEKFTECHQGQWSFEETVERFHRLLLVRLGILIPSEK